MKIFIAIFVTGLLLSNGVHAQDFLYEHAEKQRTRINQMSEIDKNGDRAIQDLTIRELIDLDCHTTANGKWVKCDWPYSPQLCASIGWVPHHDGSCCKQIGYHGPFSYKYE